MVRVVDMTHQVHSFEPPERFVAGTVGAPGERSFYLQASSPERVTSVLLEKEQVAALAHHLTCSPARATACHRRRRPSRGPAPTRRAAVP